jgi:DNA-binding NarL/FixJ family response regulator
VVLMDIDLGADSGIDATARVREVSPGSAVVALTMHDAEDVVLAAIEAGASGYVLKGADQDELTDAVRAAARGEAVFGAGVADRVLARLRGASGARRTPPDELGLTDREGEVLELMAEGWGNQAIAGRLFLSPKTVRNNVSSILTKLHAADRGSAVVLARAAGYGRGTAGPP